MSRAVPAAVLLLVLCGSLPAQRGGMRGGGIRGGGGGGARVGFGRPAAPVGFGRAPQIRPQFFAPRSPVFARPRSAFVRPGFVPQQRTFATVRNTNRPFIFTRGFNGRFGHHHFHHFSSFFAFPYYGAYWPLDYGYGGYGDYWNPYSFGSYSYDPAANTSNYTDLSNQTSQLSSEIEQLRDENDSLRSSLYEQQRPSAAPPPPATIGTTSGNEPATVFVYRDGHRAEVSNYAIVGSTVWILSATRAAKVPLSELNIDQTVKVNEDRGVTFQVPKQ